MEAEHIALVKEILIRKIQGTDCTEEESAEIKQFLHNFKMWEVDNVLLATKLSEHFPMELGEVITEMFSCEERAYLEGL